jgi:type I restriction enzyme R subunit
VLDYFDAAAIGMTATPALHTTEIFGTPIYNYTYREAVIDGFLIDHEPPYLIKTKLGEEGKIWERGDRLKVYDKENNQIIGLAELEDELAINIEGFNKMVITEPFNRTAISQLVQLIDPDGEEKTLIFAATDEHADLVVSILKEEYEKIGCDLNDNAIQKITGKSYDPEEQVRRYKNEKYPTIAVTVDLLTTGIDVPAICNIVFLRRVKSRILYEQMLGSATRRCDEIDKEVFRIYDAVQIYEALQDYTQMKPVTVNPLATFEELAAELGRIDSNERAAKQLDQIIAKFRRKCRYITDDNIDHADIISFIRNMALGDALISHEDRIRRAVEKVRAMKSWNRIQQKWIDRFEHQLLSENILQHDDLNQAPFNENGGFDRLNKVFEEQLDQLISQLNENLYQTA